MRFARCRCHPWNSRRNGTVRRLWGLPVGAAHPAIPFRRPRPSTRARTTPASVPLSRIRIQVVEFDANGFGVRMVEVCEDVEGTVPGAAAGRLVAGFVVGVAEVDERVSLEVA